MTIFCGRCVAVVEGAVGEKALIAERMMGIGRRLGTRPRRSRLPVHDGAAVDQVAKRPDGENGGGGKAAGGRHAIRRLDLLSMQFRNASREAVQKVRRTVRERVVLLEDGGVLEAEVSREVDDLAF